MAEDASLMFCIICATYNRADKLPRAINSIFEQSVHNWELIIVDDGSTDNTKEVVAPYLTDKRINFFSMVKNCGVGVARNFGIRQAKAEWIVLLDSDNALLPGALLAMINAIQSHSNSEMHKFSVRSFVGQVMCDVPVSCITVTGFDYLCGKFSGEHHTLVKKRLLLSHPFFEEINGGEGVIWAKIVLECKSLVYHPSFTQLYETEGADRLSVRAKNYSRLRQVFWIDISTLWWAYLKACPSQLLIRSLKLIFYYFATKFQRTAI